MEIIKVENKLVFSNIIVETGAKVESRLAKLDIDKQIATIETIGTLKKLRAELNKESKTFKGQLKSVIDGISIPIIEMKELFKEHISEPYAKAESLLKENIGVFETKIKQDKEGEIKAYFKELCENESINFVEFERMNLEVNLSTSLKKYKEQCNDFITQISDSLLLIESGENKDEILVEFKKTLNISASIMTVNNRIKTIAEEKKASEIKELQKREFELKQLGFKKDAELKVFAYSLNIYISFDAIKELDGYAFSEKIVAFKQEIEKTKQTAKATIKAPITQPKTENKTPELSIETARFEVKGTLEQLMKVGQFLRENNLSYTNI